MLKSLAPPDCHDQSAEQAGIQLEMCIICIIFIFTFTVFELFEAALDPFLYLTANACHPLKRGYSNHSHPVDCTLLMG